MALSKLGMIEASEATKYLTSMLKGFNLEASDSMDIVSKLTKVDMHYAASAGGIAEALSQTAVSARLAGVNIDNIVGYATEIIETSQASPSRVGNALKTMFSRYGNVKAGVFTKMSLLEGDEGDTSSTENINDIEKVLHKLGISIRSSALEMRPFEDVIADVAAKWQTLNSVSKNAVATALGGTRQREFINILLENYSTAEEISEMSRTSSGTAETKYDAYLDSVEAAQKRLISSWEGFIQKLDSSGLLKILYNLASTIIDYAPLLIRALTMKFVGDRMFSQMGIAPAVTSGAGILSNIRLTPNGQGGFALTVGKSASATPQAAPTAQISPILDAYGHPTQKQPPQQTPQPKQEKGLWKDFGKGAAVSAGLGLLAGLSAGLLGSGSNRDKTIKGLTTGLSTTIGGVLGALIGKSSAGTMIGSQAGSIVGEWLSDLFITAADREAKQRDEAIEKASNAIVQAIERNDSIERISELTSGAVLSAEDYSELKRDATSIGSALLSSYEGQKRWEELTGHTLDENTDAITDLNNTLVSGDFLEKWKAVMALQIINTEHIIEQQTEQAQLTEKQLEDKFKSPSVWDYVFQEDLMIKPGAFVPAVSDAIREYTEAGGKHDYNKSSISPEQRQKLMNSAILPYSLIPRLVVGELVRQGIMTAEVEKPMISYGNPYQKTEDDIEIYEAGGKFTKDFIEQGAPKYEIEQAVQTVLTNEGMDPFSTQGQALVQSIVSDLMSGTTEGLQDYVNYNELVKEIRGSNIQLAYQNMAFALEDETLHSLTLNQITGRIASSLADIEGEGNIYEADGTTIRSSIKTEITNYLKTIDALNSRFNDASGSFTTLASKWKLLKEQVKDSPDLQDDLDSLGQTIISTANAWGIYTQSAEDAIQQMEQMPEYMRLITSEDVFRNTTDTAARLTAVDDMLDKLYNRQGLSAEDISTLSTQFAQAGITGDLSNRSSTINSLMALRDTYTQLYTGKYAQDQLTSSYVFQALINEMTNKFSGFTQVADVWNKLGITDFSQLDKAGYGASELASLGISDYTQTDWYRYLQKYLNSMVTEIESVAKRVQAARKVLEYDLNLEIDNLTAQKTALEDINNQREYELTLIKAKQKLEDAKNQKQRVWREGVGWVYEANQEAIANAQKELEDIENRKTLSEIEAQIKELQYSKDMISKIASAKEVADLRKEYNTFIGATATANEALLRLQKEWEGKMSLGNIFDQVKNLNNLEVAFAASDAQTAYDAYVNGTYDNTIAGQRKKLAAYQTYQAAQQKLITLVKGTELEKDYKNQAYYLGQDSSGDGLIAPTMKSPTFTFDGKSFIISSWDENNMTAGNRDETVVRDLEDLDKEGQNPLGDVDPTLDNALLWANTQGNVIQIGEKYYTIVDNHFIPLKEAPKAATGHLSFPGGPALINEEGTEGIITPQGTLTALPSGSGIVPADITKNVWALGEVAPNLLRSLASLEAKGIINNNNSSMTEDSLIINSLMIKMNADKDFNIDKFVKELKTAADLSRHY